jgi:hypothetical protein
MKANERKNHAIFVDADGDGLFLDWGLMVW